MCLYYMRSWPTLKEEKMEVGITRKQVVNRSHFARRVKSDENCRYQI